MDIVDRVTYDFEWEGFLPEATRQAFVNLFDVENEDSRLVMRHLISICKWEDQTEYNDPIIEAKMNSLRGVIREIKKQLNMKPIEVVEPEGEDNE
jgi:hypothetical protein